MPTPPAPARDGRFLAITSGNLHTCALHHDGTPICWGNDKYGQSSPPRGERFTSISSGSSHTCALRQDGTPVCWGDDTNRQSSPPGYEDFTAISSGTSIPAHSARTARLSAGATMDLGSHRLLMANASPPSAAEIFTPVPTKRRFNGVLGSTDGPPELASEGPSTLRRLAAGLGATMDLGSHRLLKGERFTAISSGDLHTCALRKDGSTVCWGSTDGRLNSPPARTSTLRAISSGSRHTCALRSDGSPLCWGYSPTGSTNPPKDEHFIAISTSDDYTCAWAPKGRYPSLLGPVGNGVIPPIDAGPLFNDFGQVSPPQGERFSAISTGDLHACRYSRGGGRALRMDGTPVCWGVGSTPVEDERFTTISSGRHQTCGLREDGSVHCWGPKAAHNIIFLPESERFTTISVSDYACGLRKDGSMVCWWAAFEQPASPPEDHKFADVATGGIQTCAVRCDGTVMCWMFDYDSATLLESENPIAISAGSHHICGLQEDGTAFCWGDDKHGEASPPQGEPFTDISSGLNFTCALRTDGTPVCWGVGISPPDGERFTTISSGNWHVCALRNDGSPVCWGWDDYGQASTPEGEQFVAISSGYTHTCGLRGDGTVVCWGWGDFGQTSPPGAG